jgi:hypothetical protein
VRRLPDGGALVAEDYPTPNDFTGAIDWVEIDVDEAAVDADHRLAPDDRHGAAVGSRSHRQATACMSARRRWSCRRAASASR